MAGFLISVSVEESEQGEIKLIKRLEVQGKTTSKIEKN